MDNLSTDVEVLIKNTAKKIFFEEGKLDATTQDIADAAGINRASIHYYFRSRKLLFDKVFEEAMAEFHTKLFAVVSKDAPITRELIGQLVDFLIKRSLEHPFLELFLVAELNSNPNVRQAIMPMEPPIERRTMLKKFIDEEVAAGGLKPIEPEQFIINVMSLCSFPCMAKPIVKHAIGLSEEAYRKFMSERKEVIMKLIFLDA
jgi:AcrR family transcriptional regulator